MFFAASRGLFHCSVGFHRWLTSLSTVLTDFPYDLNCFRFNSFIVVLEKFILSEGVESRSVDSLFLRNQGVSQIIGITSLCLYHSAFSPFLQDGMVYKIQSLPWYKKENFLSAFKKYLTSKRALWYTEYVGRPKWPPFYTSF